MKNQKLKELKKLRFEAIKIESLTTIKGGYRGDDATYRLTGLCPTSCGQVDIDY